jgi:hypothetical protein
VLWRDGRIASRQRARAGATHIALTHHNMICVCVRVVIASTMPHLLQTRRLSPGEARAYSAASSYGSYTTMPASPSLALSNANTPMPLDYDGMCMHACVRLRLRNDDIQLWHQSQCDPVRGEIALFAHMNVLHTF